MKNFIKENWSKLLLVLVVIIFIIILSSKTANETKKHFIGYNLSNTTQITCTYPQIMTAAYTNDEIVQSLPKPETHPLIFTFSNLRDPKVGQLSYIDSTQTITNVSLLKLIDDNEKIMYLEGTGETYLTVHTIFKKSGVATYSKNINFLGMIPEVASAMGSCVGY